jgi:hypothetical protein
MPAASSGSRSASSPEAPRSGALASAPPPRHVHVQPPLLDAVREGGLDHAWRARPAEARSGSGMVSGRRRLVRFHTRASAGSSEETLRTDAPSEPACRKVAFGGRTAVGPVGSAPRVGRAVAASPTWT